MSLQARARDAAVEAVLAGGLAGLFEGSRIALHAGGAVLPLAAAVAGLGAIVLALVVRALVAASERIPAVASWRSELASGGHPRVGAAWRALVWTGAIATFGWGAFRAFVLVHDRYRLKDVDAMALLYVLGLIGAGAGLAALAGALDRRVRDRLPASLFDGPRVWLLGGIGALTVVGGPPFVVGRAAPMLSLDGVALGSVTVVAVLAMRIGRPGRARAARIGAVVVLLAAVVGASRLSTSSRARGAITDTGVASEQVARLLRRLGDRDHDRFAGPGAGGADCDDHDPGRNPRALDVPDNGVDENCTGADAVSRLQGLRAQRRPAPTTLTRPNIVLISVDALRADHLGAYGYHRPTSPTLDALAAQGVRFARAYTSCPSTRCALPSLLTGRYASTLGAGPDREAIPSLARVLRDAGWTTSAITCCERFALGRDELDGFITLDASADAVRMQRAGQSNADVVVDRALAWLAGLDRSKPYFAWLHLYEPHSPYQAPAGPSFGDDEVARYDREIAFLDAQLARLLAALDPSTIVVVTADHGEEFGEHGIRFHARSLYNQVVRVPLLVRVPGVAPGVVPAPVSIVDIMPTLLELAGVEGPAGMNGSTLVPLLRGGPAPARPVFVELLRDHQIARDMAAVISPPWKAIWDRDANAWSLFRIDDEADTTNRADDAALPELQRLLMDTIDRETSGLRR